MDLRKLAICLIAMPFAAAAEMSHVSSSGASLAASAQSTVTVPNTTLSMSGETTALEEGKALYENGQFIAALGKFMTVLRKDPHQPEARQYLRMVIDIMRQNPAIAASRIGASGGQAVVASPVVQEEVRKMLQQRALFTMDLKAIPGVQFSASKNVNQVEIDTGLLFEENSGGLKEQGIPVLDRVGAWLKTYGQQPVIIHCYPEELQDPSKNGSLFLHRYSELFNFFVEERKLPPQRFVSADLSETAEPSPAALSSVGLALSRVHAGEGGADGTDAGGEGKAAVLSSASPHIVIETIGSQSIALDAMPSASPTKALSRWLELSITTTRAMFNPEEGEWVSLDVAALTRTGLKDWVFQIFPTEGKKSRPVFEVQGKGNLLKRIAWDGHDQKTGSFVSPGAYMAKLQATDGDGTMMNRDASLEVLRAAASEAVLVEKPTPKVARKPKAKKLPTKVVNAASPDMPSPPVGDRALPNSNSAPSPASLREGGRRPDEGTPHPVAAAATPSPARGEGTSAADDSDSLIDSKPASSNASSDTATHEGAPTAALGDDGQEGGDSVHAIWKQVIQFEPGQSELMPTVKSSLERIGKTLEVYPLQKVRITGFAMASEANAEQLARQRAESVRAILVNEYHVDQKRVIVAGGKTTSDENASKVEMSITN